MIKASPPSRFKTITSDDPAFLIQEGFVVMYRAGLIFANSCPSSVKHTVAKAISDGHITLTATVPTGNTLDYQYELDLGD